MTTALMQPDDVLDLVGMDALQKILDLLDETGVSQQELEQRAHLSEGKIRKWKRGEHKPPRRHHLIAIADALGVPRSRLVEESTSLVPPAMAYLTELVSRYGVDACVRWILAGAEAKDESELWPSGIGRPVRVVEGPNHLDDLPPKPRRDHERADPADVPARRKGKGRP